MDEKSHELFAGILLEAIGNSTTSPKWGIAPDIDMGFFHRWYRHRISVLPKIYLEFPSPERLPGYEMKPYTDADLDAITLCIVSHLYLDIFNGWVFPFGIYHPIYPKKTIISGVLEDMNNPKLLVKQLRRLAGEETYLNSFYSDSEKIVKKMVTENAKTKDLISQMVWRLAYYADMKSRASLYDEAMHQIADFTGNAIYKRQLPPDRTHDACSLFENEYATIINKALEE